jgi:hypothetical protein
MHLNLKARKKMTSVVGVVGEGLIVVDRVVEAEAEGEGEDSDRFRCWQFFTANLAYILVHWLLIKGPI